MSLPIPEPHGATQIGYDPYAEILAEMDKIRQGKTASWGGTILILAISVILFIAFGRAVWGGWKLIVILIPILFFHELGHYIAMRIFGYRNVRMFFIPLFGAAVTGQNYNVAGWKKVVVALAGPLPGIMVGSICAIAGIIAGHDLLIEIATITLLLNGKLISSILPLDGGQVAQALLFSRHYALDAAFRGLAGLSLIGLAILMGGGGFLIVIGIFMLMGIPLAIQMGKIAFELKQSNVPLPLPNEQSIPPETAIAIIDRLKLASPKTPNKLLAQKAIQVFETLNTCPPGIGETLGLAAAYAGTFFIAMVMGLVILVAKERSMMHDTSPRTIEF